MRFLQRSFGTAWIPVAWRAIVLVGIAVPLAVRANPTGGTVVAGSAGIAAPNSTTVVVTQSSNRAIINWSDFSIGSGQVTKFIQPSAASAILNRVVGSDPSTLLGSLQSNGQVYLINPNGIVVGQGARIDTAGFAASTLDASNSEFLAGGDLHLSGQSGAAVANLGAIGASQGNVYMVAQQVTNAGSITASGTVGLAAGTQVTLTQNGTEHVLVGAAVTSAGGGAGGAAVVNSGTIRGAQAELKALDGNLYALAINNTGVVRATGARTVGGRIYLVADGAVDVGGTVDAGSSGAGGQVIATGSSVTVASGAVISANGGTHGGTVLIGGDRAGGSNPSIDLLPAPVANAGHTTVAAGARISANGGSGNGGDVVVWSDDATDFEGAISARGGQGASGGFAEVSSHRVLNFTGTVDLTAPFGAMGTLLLDPEDVTISNAATFNGSISGGTFTPTGDSSILNVTDLATALNLSNVIVTTGAIGLQSGNITIANALTWVPPGAGSSLSLIAAGGVFINAALTIPANGSLSVTSGTGAITQTAPITQVGAGTVSFNAGANAITLTQSNTFTGVVSLANSGANDVALTNSGALALGASTIGRNLTLIAGGSITETGAITANGGTTSLAVTVAGSDLLLGGQANDFGTVAPVFGAVLADIRDVSLRNTNAGAVLPSFAGLTSLRNLTLSFDNAAMSLPALTLTNAGSLAVTAGGAITQTGVATVPGTSSFTAGANVITLTQNNALTGAVSLSNSGANNVSLTNALATVLGASSVGSGTVAVVSTGAITQNGVFTEAAGTASFSAGANAITLGQNNDFTGAVSLTNSGANNVAVTNSVALAVGASTVGKNLSLTAGGSITETGAITAAGGTTTLAVTAAGSDILLGSQANNLGVAAPVFGGVAANIRDVSLRNINAGAILPSFAGLTNLRNLTLFFDSAAIALPALTLTSGGNLAVTAGGAITQTGIATVPGTSSFTAGAHAITLNQANSLTGAVSLSNSGLNNVLLTNGIATALGTSGVGTGTFTVTSTGAITETGAVTQALAAGVATFTAGANAITLNQANSLTGTVVLSNSGANNVSLTNGVATKLGASGVGSGTFKIGRAHV